MGTGDLLLTRCMTLPGMMVGMFARSWFTHVAMVVRNPSTACLSADDDDDDACRIFVLESDVPSTQLIPLSAWLSAYSGMGPELDVVWRKFLYRRSGDDTVAVLGIEEEAFEAAVRRSCQCAYPTMLEMAMGTMALRPPTRRSVAHCVQTVCGALRSIGVLSADVRTNRWNPDALSSPRWATSEGGWAYAREIILKHQHHDGQRKIEERRGDQLPHRTASIALGGSPPEDGGAHEGHGPEQVEGSIAETETDEDDDEENQGQACFGDGDDGRMGRHGTLALAVGSPSHDVVEGEAYE